MYDWLNSNICVYTYKMYFTKIWQGILRSKREGLLIYNHKSLVEVSFDENHEFSTSFMNEVGASVSSKQHIELKGIC